jgi:hypothetical protein
MCIKDVDEKDLTAWQKSLRLKFIVTFCYLLGVSFSVWMLDIAFVQPCTSVFTALRQYIYPHPLIMYISGTGSVVLLLAIVFLALIPYKGKKG